MAESEQRRGRIWPGLVAAGAGAAAVGAAWAAQHRVVSRSTATSEEVVGEGLALPGDLRHHFVEMDDGGRIHVVERGQGPPVVLLHGFSLSVATWTHQLRDLAPRYRVIALDLRGHGQSLPGRAGLGGGVGRLAEDLLTVLDALEVGPALLVGHSMGGMISLEALLRVSAADREGLVSGLALVSTTGGPIFGFPGYRILARLGGPVAARGLSLAARSGIEGLPSGDLRWWASRMGFGPEAPPAQVRFVEAMSSTTPLATVAALAGVLGSFDVSGRLGELEVPTLVVVGSKDRMLPPRHARALAAGLPQAELVELPRCGHMPMLERRFEFSRLLGEFDEKVAVGH